MKRPKPPPSLPEDLAPKHRASALNARVQGALRGDNNYLAGALCELLESGAEIALETRAMLVEAIRGDSDPPVTIRFVGVGEKSSAGMIATRRRWLDIAREFHASGLTQGAFLDSRGAGLQRDSENLLQKAVAFYQAYRQWVETDPDELCGLGGHCVDQKEWALLSGAVFCEFAVDNGLLTSKDLRDFLREGRAAT